VSDSLVPAHIGCDGIRILNPVCCSGCKFACALEPELPRTKSMPGVGSGYPDRRNPSHGSPYRVGTDLKLLTQLLLENILFMN